MNKEINCYFCNLPCQFFSDERMYYCLECQTSSYPVSKYHYWSRMEVEYNNRFYLLDIEKNNIYISLVGKYSEEEYRGSKQFHIENTTKIPIQQQFTAQELRDIIISYLPFL